MSRPFFSIKYPPLLKRTCMPCSTIWPTKTKFFVIVGTCKTLLMQLFLSSLLDGMLSMCRMDVWCRLPSLRSQVDPNFLSHETILGVTSYDLRHWSRRIFRIGVGYQHGVSLMTHDEHSTLVFKVEVGVIVCEFPACGIRLTSFLLALLFTVANLPTIVAGNGPIFFTLFSMETSSSSKVSLTAFVLVPKV